MKIGRAPLAYAQKIVLELQVLRRRGRVVEGTPLLREHVA